MSLLRQVQSRGEVPSLCVLPCAQGNEDTFTFLEAVLKEVLALFPSEHIHIGGDEVCSCSPTFCSQARPSLRQCLSLLKGSSQPAA